MRNIKKDILLRVFVFFIISCQLTMRSSLPKSVRCEKCDKPCSKKYYPEHLRKVHRIAFYLKPGRPKKIQTNSGREQTAGQFQMPSGKVARAKNDRFAPYNTRSSATELPKPPTLAAQSNAGQPLSNVGTPINQNPADGVTKNAAVALALQINMQSQMQQRLMPASLVQSNISNVAPMSGAVPMQTTSIANFGHIAPTSHDNFVFKFECEIQVQPVFEIPSTLE